MIKLVISYKKRKLDAIMAQNLHSSKNSTNLSLTLNLRTKIDPISQYFTFTWTFVQASAHIGPQNAFRKLDLFFLFGL